jgi:cytidine deaminase
MKYKHEINYERYEKFEGLSTIDRQLVSEAKRAMNQAYAPYSKFKVGSAILLSDGSIVKGNNQENIAYPSGLCAERVALFYAGSNYPDAEVVSIVIVAEGTFLQHQEMVSPCGACRQVMLETERRQTNTLRIILVSHNGQVFVFHSAKDLLPFAFGS